MGPPKEVRPNLSATPRTSPAEPADGAPVDADPVDADPGDTDLVDPGPVDAGPTESLATMGCLWSQNPDGSRFIALRAHRQIEPVELGHEK